MGTEQGNEKKKLRAFHGDPAQKAFYLKRIKKHRIAHQIAQKHGYWYKKEYTGDAIGCTIHSFKFKDYETLLGIPLSLALAEKYLFEYLPLAKAQKWPEMFLNAISVGADLSQVWSKFVVWMLVDSEGGVIKFVKTDEQRQAIREVARLYREDCKDLSIWSRASKDANILAGGVVNFDVMRDALLAADCAACAACDIITVPDMSFEYRLDVTLSSAARAVAAGTGVTRMEAHERQAKKLLQLLKKAPMVAKITSAA